MIIPHDSARCYVAVSYQTSTFNDLKFLLAQSGIDLTRIDPEVFLTTVPDSSNLYVNMVATDLTQRKKVTETIDAFNLDRFSYIHESAAIWSHLKGQGLLIFPFVGTMTDVVIGNDVIMFGHNGIAHGTHIGTGCIIDAYTMIAGSSKLGNFCRIRSRVTVYDKVTIADHVIVAANSTIRKDILKPGVYATIAREKTVKLADQ
jgi:carbonic anhydrase/acetyltransferase-like protein (isoleucine patch superfamily)